MLHHIGDITWQLFKAAKDHISLPYMTSMAQHEALLQKWLPRVNVSLCGGKGQVKLET